MGGLIAFFDLRFFPEKGKKSPKSNLQGEVLELERVPCWWVWLWAGWVVVFISGRECPGRVNWKMEFWVSMRNWVVPLPCSASGGGGGGIIWSPKSALPRDKGYITHEGVLYLGGYSLPR